MQPSLVFQTCCLNICWKISQRCHWRMILMTVAAKNVTAPWKEDSLLLAGCTGTGKTCKGHVGNPHRCHPLPLPPHPDLTPNPSQEIGRPRVGRYTFRTCKRIFGSHPLPSGDGGIKACRWPWVWRTEELSSSFSLTHILMCMHILSRGLTDVLHGESSDADSSVQGGGLFRGLTALRL